MAESSLSFVPRLPAKGSDEQLRLLIKTGLTLSSERSVEAMVEAALKSAMELCGAAFGVFHYMQENEAGKPQLQCRTVGLEIAQTAGFEAGGGLSALFKQGESTVESEILRFADLSGLSADLQRRYLAGFPSCRSYLAVPVHDRGSALVGGLILGHPHADTFPSECEELIATVASQAAIAMENARLRASLVLENIAAEKARALQRETATRFRQALESAQLGTWNWHRATDLLDLDERARELFGVRSDETITRTALRERIVTPQDLQMTTDRLRQALESGGHYYAEYRIDLPDGRHSWIAASGISIYPQGSSETTGMVGTVQDITTRKTQENTLRESEKLAATGRLAATIAHEINNPLEAITNLIYLSRTDPAVPDDVKGLLQTADAELARVSQIAQQTLAFYRDTTRPVTIDIGELLSATVDLFDRKMRSRGLTCTLELESGLQIFGLQGEVRQVFSNLLVNAIDASFNSSIHLRARLRRQNGVDGVSVLVCDRGAGIPIAVRQHLFAPFITTKQSVGTGLGLWVTRGIVEKQGGTVAFRTSTEQPSGTVFRVFLPMRPPASAQ